jgi:Protein of unknown function (DUF2408)
LGYSTKLAANLEPIDESLKPTEEKLSTLREDLRYIRSHRAKLVQANQWKRGFSSVYQQKLNLIHEELEQLGQARVNAQFVNAKGEAPMGQLALKSLLDECYCLYLELNTLKNEGV